MEDEPFGIATDAVLEVMEIPDYIELPGSAAWLVGMTLYRSQPIAVVDLPAFVFDLARATVPAQRAMVVSMGWGRIALMVQRIDGLVQAVAPATESSREAKPCFDLCQTADGQVLQLLNLAQLGNAEDFLNPAGQADRD
jgi:chemotaxis signal transduction protein